MRTEVTVSACQHLPSVALAKQSFPYVLAGSVIARSLTVCVNQKHGMVLFKTAMPRFFINSQLTGKSTACMDEDSICATGGSFHVMSDGLGVRPGAGRRWDWWRLRGGPGSKMNTP